VMMFVDGENLAIRYGSLLQNTSPVSHIVYEPSVFVWSRFASRERGPQDFIRRYLLHVRTWRCRKIGRL
jgi:hypothetical protein